MSMGYDTSDVSMPDLLLIEDNPLHVRLVRSMLEEVWYGVGRLVHVTRVTAAIAYLVDHTPQCILLDLHLPDADGLTGLDQVQAVAPGVPVVVLSAHEDQETALNAIRRGAQDYLVKGDVPADGIARAIRFAIERGRRDRLPHDELVGVYAVLDESGTVVFAESGFLEMTGRPAGDVVGAHVASVWNPASAGPLSDALRVLGATGGRDTLHVEMLRPDGSAIPVDATVSGLDGGVEEPGGFVVRVRRTTGVSPALAAPPA